MSANNTTISDSDSTPIRSRVRRLSSSADLPDWEGTSEQAAVSVQPSVQQSAEQSMPPPKRRPKAVGAGKKAGAPPQTAADDGLPIAKAVLVTSSVVHNRLPVA
jgi:hypothetical protein